MTREPEVIDAWSATLDEALAEILSSIPTMALATGGQGREPYVAPLFFAAGADLTCYFLSDPETRHGQEMALVGSVAAAIYPDEPDWQRLRGIQLTGSVRSLEETESRDEAWSVYTARFPMVAELPEAVARSAFYALTPDWLRLVDNRRGFGFRREWRLRPR